MSVLFGVWSVAHSVSELLDRALAGSGLNADEFGFYSALFDGQPITPNQISEQLGMPPTTVSSFLGRLSARGHISRSKNPADGRSALIELTSEGQQILHEAWMRFVPAQVAVEEALALPVEQVIDTLRQLTKAVQAAAARDTPEPIR
ncbi:MAG: MarR family winged helix-turn-helix transcriptional regulator [Gaiellaceae bacterium]